MTSKFLFAIFCFLAVTGMSLNAQEMKKPLAPKVVNEEIPYSPGDRYVWIKGHWEWNDRDYEWIEGRYVLAEEGFAWVDGYWERNQKTGWWVFNSGYWQKTSSNVQFAKNIEVDKNTLVQPKQNKSAFGVGGIEFKKKPNVK